MTKIQEPIEQLNEIRNLMERSSRFISLSGSAGVLAGAAALGGAAIAWFADDVTTLFLMTDAIIVLIIALSAGIYFTVRRAARNKEKIWDRSARRLVLNMMIPLAAGGLFCLILLTHDQASLLPSATLVFYGLALVNASKYTLPDIRILGIAEIVLGLVAGWFTGYGLIIWAVGFGLLHIIYGIAMYNRYEKVR
jgi:hypothetical protein